MTSKQLRQFAIGNTLFPATSLAEALSQLQFVQADPIRSPARAQDLVLRQRVTDYRNGDLERNAAELKLEEDFLYAHGFLQPDVWQLLHPRLQIELTDFDRQVLEVIKDEIEVQPKELIERLGSKSEKNWWGGNSQASRMSLERLHYYGLVRITGRRNGIRIYAPYNAPEPTLTTDERLEQLILVIAHILAPVSYPTLRQSLQRLRRLFGPTQTAITRLLKDGRLIQQKIDGIEYLWPATANHSSTIIPVEVKILAPFDPLVWDRLRFEQLWGWPYRFEAYTPKEKRIRGYYAMPLLWRDEMIGWANVSKAGEVELGFVNGRPKDANFERELAVEISRLRTFLS